jgi:hypothetical protein
MIQKNYTATITVSALLSKSFQSINDISKWWTEDFEGDSHKLNDEFSVRFGDIHFSKQKLVEFIPDKKVVWLVTDSKLNFIKQQHEWTGTKISFELSSRDNKTQIHFTHFGLVPDVECFDACSQGWDQYFKGSLYKFLTEGKGHPGSK